MNFKKVIISCLVLIVFVFVMSVVSKSNVNNSDPKLAKFISSIKSFQTKLVPKAFASGGHDDTMKLWYYWVVGWKSVDRFVADNQNGNPGDSGYCTTDNWNVTDDPGDGNFCDSIGIGGLLGRYGSYKGLVPDILDMVSTAVQTQYGHVCLVPNGETISGTMVDSDGEMAYTLNSLTPEKSSPASYATNGGVTYDKRFTLTVPSLSSSGPLAAVEFYCSDSETASNAGYLMLNYPEPTGVNRVIEVFYDTENSNSKVAEFYMTYDNNPSWNSKQRFALKMEINAGTTTFKYHMTMVNQSGATSYNSTKMHAIGNYSTNNYLALMSYIGGQGAHTSFDGVGNDANATSSSTTHDDADYSLGNGEIMVICLTGGSFSQNLADCSGLTLEPTPTSGLGLSNNAKLTIDYVAKDSGMKADIYSE